MSIAITVRLPKRCIEIIDEMVKAGIFTSRSEAVRFIVRYSLVEGIHKKLLPKKKEESTNVKVCRKAEEN